MKHLYLTLLLLLVASLSPATTYYTIYLSGKISSVDDNSNLLGGSIRVNDNFTATIVYDRDVIDSNPLPSVGVYWNTDSNTGMTVTIGSHIFKTLQNSSISFLIDLINKSTSSFLVRSYTNISEYGTSFDMSWQLDDATGTALKSDKISDVTDLSKFTADWGVKISFENVYTGDLFYINGSVNSISINSGLPVMTSLNNVQTANKSAYIANNQLIVNAENNSRVELYDINGRLQLNTVFQGNPVDVSSLPKGIYLAVVRNNGSVFRIKVINK